MGIGRIGRAVRGIGKAAKKGLKGVKGMAKGALNPKEMIKGGLDSVTGGAASMVDGGLNLGKSIKNKDAGGIVESAGGLLGL